MHSFKILFSVGAAGTALYVASNSDGGFGEHCISKIFQKNCVNAASAYQSAAKDKGWDHNWDKRDPFNLINPAQLDNIDAKDTESSKNDVNRQLRDHMPTATRHLLFIRHGQYNTKFKEDEKRTLTPLGQEQAIYTGIRLRDLDLYYDTVIESSMTRAIETCSLICDQLSDSVKVVRTDLLREGSPIKPEPPFRHWRSDVSTFTDGPRIESAFRKFVHRAEVSQKNDSVEIIVCHANVIRYIVCRALQLPPEAWLRMSIHHGSITWLTIRPNGFVTLRCLGESGHMPPDKLTVE